MMVEGSVFEGFTSKISAVKDKDKLNGLSNSC